MLLKWHQLAKAPPQVGLYAWYLVPRLSKANLASMDNTITDLATSAAQLRFPDMTVLLTGQLSLSFSGEILHEHLGRDSYEGYSTVKRILEEPQAREELALLLDQVVPWFCSPLYIGVSSNLKRRLSDHARMIRAPQEPADVGVDGEAASRRDHSFAKAVRDRQINENQLSVYIHPLTDDSWTLDDDALEPRAFVEGAETILNRLFYPILGRR